VTSKFGGLAVPMRMTRRRPPTYPHHSNAHMNHTSNTLTRFGEFTYFTHDDPIGLSLLKYGEWAQDEIQFLREFVRPGSLVVDIGANVGTHTVSFSHLVGTAGRVVSFEPQPAVFEVLEANVANCALPNVQCIRGGAGEHWQELGLEPIDYSSHNNFGAISLNDSSNANCVKVPVRPVDSLELQQCELIKIDAEGMELSVLKGLHQTLKRCRPILFIECNDANHGLSLYQHLNQDYDFFLVSTSAYNSDNFNGISDNVFGVAHEASLLCIPIGRVPEFTSILTRVGVAHLPTPSELVLRHNEVPRYGDTTDHDRNLESWRQISEQTRVALKAAEEALSRSNFRETSLRHTRDRALSRLAALEGCAAEITRLNQEVADIRASTSWRVTSPLRVFMNLVRRVLR